MESVSPTSNLVFLLTIFETIEIVCLCTVSGRHASLFQMTVDLKLRFPCDSSRPSWLK